MDSNLNPTPTHPSDLPLISSRAQQKEIGLPPPRTPPVQIPGLGKLSVLPLEIRARIYLETEEDLQIEISQQEERIQAITPKKAFKSLRLTSRLIQHDIETYLFESAKATAFYRTSTLVGHHQVLDLLLESLTLHQKRQIHSMRFILVRAGTTDTIANITKLDLINASKRLLKLPPNLENLELDCCCEQCGCVKSRYWRLEIRRIGIRRLRIKVTACDYGELVMIWLFWAVVRCLTERGFRRQIVRMKDGELAVYTESS